MRPPFFFFFCEDQHNPLFSGTNPNPNTNPKLYPNLNPNPDPYLNHNGDRKIDRCFRFFLIFPSFLPQFGQHVYSRSGSWFVTDTYPFIHDGYILKLNIYSCSPINCSSYVIGVSLKTQVHHLTPGIFILSLGQQRRVWEVKIFSGEEKYSEKCVKGDIRHWSQLTFIIITEQRQGPIQTSKGVQGPGYIWVLTVCELSSRLSP